LHTIELQDSTNLLRSYADVWKYEKQSFCWPYVEFLEPFKVIKMRFFSVLQEAMKRISKQNRTPTKSTTKVIKSDIFHVGS